MIEAVLKSPKFFPTLIIVLQALASIRYFANKELGQGMYWLMAVGLNSAVTYMMGK